MGGSSVCDLMAFDRHRDDSDNGRILEEWQDEGGLNVDLGKCI